VLLEAGLCIAVEFARTALEGGLPNYAVDVVQYEPCSLKVVRARLAPVVVRHQMFPHQVPQYFGSADFATNLTAMSGLFQWGS
jgi:hypothetical protein